MKIEIEATKLQRMLDWASFVAGYIKATHPVHSMEYVYVGDLQTAISELISSYDNVE